MYKFFIIFFFATLCCKTNL